MPMKLNIRKSENQSQKESQLEINEKQKLKEASSMINTSGSFKTLYFKHYYGKLEVVKENIQYKDCFSLIRKFCRKLNPKFKIYYIRSYAINDVTHFDVGSHSEFFYWTDKDISEL